jgi:hypothetical protein
MTNHRLLLFVSVLLLIASANDPGQAAWSTRFQPPGVAGSPSGQVFDMCNWNGMLVVSGYFDDAGGKENAGFIAGWNGRHWVTFEEGVSAEPEFVERYGESILVGGHLNGMIEKWDGLTWSTMDGINGVPDACAVTSGNTIFVGGSFFSGVATPLYTPLFEWTGGAWEYAPIGGWDLSDDTNDIVYFNSMLYVGGTFANSIIASPDTTWGLLGFETDERHDTSFGRGVNGTVYDLEQGDMGVWVGGNFTHADGAASAGLAWLGPGGTWVPCSDGDGDRQVHALTMITDILYVLERTGTYPYDYRVRTYDDGLWQSTLEDVFDDALFCLGNDGTDIYAGGLIRNGIARWDDGEWVHLGGGIGTRNQNMFLIYDLQAFDGDIIACGLFDLPSFMKDQYFSEDVARWDGDAWHRMGSGLPSAQAVALTVFEEQLYVGTYWQGRLYRWNGDDWDAFGGINGQVRALAVHDGELIVGGTFTEVDGQAIERLAAFNGTTWRALGGGFDNTVDVLFSDGVSLYAGGNFTNVGGVPAERIARWDGAVWTSMGDGFDDYVHALTHFQGDLIVGGDFTMSGATPLGRIARWDGLAWQPLGTGVDGADMVTGVGALRGTTSTLYVGGDFDTASGAPAAGLAYWNGATWNEFAGGVSNDGNRATVLALMVEDGDLWLGGNFLEAGGTSSCNIARWIDGGITSAEQPDHPVEPEAGPPRAAMRLLEATPNPFNPSTRIAFELDRCQHVRLEVFDLTGRSVALLADEPMGAGPQSRIWRGLGPDGRPMPSGTYIVRLGSESRASSMKVMLIR